VATETEDIKPQARKSRSEGVTKGTSSNHPVTPPLLFLSLRLVFGYWSLFVFWDLLFGISPLPLCGNKTPQPPARVTGAIDILPSNSQQESLTTLLRQQHLLHAGKLLAVIANRRHAIEVDATREIRGIEIYIMVPGDYATLDKLGHHATENVVHR